MYYCQPRESDPGLIIPFILFLFILLVIYMVNETFFALVILFLFFGWVFLEFMLCCDAMGGVRRAGRSGRKSFRGYVVDDEGVVEDE